MTHRRHWASLIDLGLSFPEPEDWTEQALCAQTDPEAFFPEKGGSTREAKRICQGCEVRDECLEYALANGIRFGIWGGFSERERRKIKQVETHGARWVAQATALAASRQARREAS